MGLFRLQPARHSSPPRQTSRPKPFANLMAFLSTKAPLPAPDPSYSAGGQATSTKRFVGDWGRGNGIGRDGVAAVWCGVRRCFAPLLWFLRFLRFAPGEARAAEKHCRTPLHTRPDLRWAPETLA